MANSHRRRIEAQQKKNGAPGPQPEKVTVEQFVERRLADLFNYFSGQLEQIMTQQGGLMGIQAATIEYLQEISDQRRKADGVVNQRVVDPVGAEERVKSLVEQNIAKRKAAREADAKVAAGIAAKKAQELADKAAEELPQVLPADPAPEAPADAPADPTGNTPPAN